MSKGDRKELVLEAIRTLGEKIDNLKDKIDTGRQISDERLERTNEALQAIAKKVDEMPERVSTIIEKEVSRCKETHVLKITSIEQKCTDCDGRIRIMEARFSTIGQAPYQPTSKLPGEPYSR